MAKRSQDILQIIAPPSFKWLLWVLNIEQGELKYNPKKKKKSFYSFQKS